MQILLFVVLYIGQCIFLIGLDLEYENQQSDKIQRKQ